MATASVGLDEELFQAFAAPERKCAWARALDGMDDATRATVAKALAEGISPGRVTTILKARSLPSADRSTVRDHVKGACACRKA